MGVFFAALEQLDTVLWSYIALTLIVSCGIYLTFYSRFYQFKVLGNAVKHIKDLIHSTDTKSLGVHPIKLYFASIGGMVGLGNIVGAIGSVLIGGPGSLLWIWLASFIGMLVKYSEIYLGIQYRLKSTSHEGYDGGPMYYLKAAFPNKVGITLASIVCVLLCIYGVEVSQFLILTDTMVSTFHIPRAVVIAILLCLVLVSAVAGVKRLSNICCALMPIFLVSYMMMTLYIIGSNITSLPEILTLIVKSAFTGHAATGGFVGSTIILAAHYGVSRAVYSGDIGIGYDSIIQSETQSQHPEKQANMAILGLFSDTLICSMSAIVVIMSGLWKVGGMQPSEYIGHALSAYAPQNYVKIYIACLYFIAGFTTIAGYFVVGQKCAKFLSPRWGKQLYIIYAIFAFISFSFFDQYQVMLIMSVSGGMLMMINLLGLIKLRHLISFPK